MLLHFLNCLIIMMFVTQSVEEIFPKRPINEPNFPESVDAFFDNGFEEDLENNFSNLRYMPQLQSNHIQKKSTEYNSMNNRGKISANDNFKFGKSKNYQREFLKTLHDDIQTLNTLIDSLKNRKRSNARHRKFEELNLMTNNEHVKSYDMDVPIMFVNQVSPLTHTTTLANVKLKNTPFQSNAENYGSSADTTVHSLLPGAVIEPATTTTRTTVKTTSITLPDIRFEPITTTIKSNIIWPESVQMAIRDLKLQRSILKRNIRSDIKNKKRRELRNRINDINLIQKILEDKINHDKKYSSTTTPATIDILMLLKTLPKFNVHNKKVKKHLNTPKKYDKSNDYYFVPESSEKKYNKNMYQALENEEFDLLKEKQSKFKSLKRKQRLKRTVNDSDQSSKVHTKKNKYKKLQRGRNYEKVIDNSNQKSIPSYDEFDDNVKRDSAPEQLFPTTQIENYDEYGEHIYRSPLHHHTKTKLSLDEDSSNELEQVTRSNAFEKLVTATITTKDHKIKNIYGCPPGKQKENKNDFLYNIEKDLNDFKNYKIQKNSNLEGIQFLFNKVNKDIINYKQYLKLKDKESKQQYSTDNYNKHRNRRKQTTTESNDDVVERIDNNLGEFKIYVNKGRRKYKKKPNATKLQITAELNDDILKDSDSEKLTNKLIQEIVHDVDEYKEYHRTSTETLSKPKIQNTNSLENNVQLVKLEYDLNDFIKHRNLQAENDYINTLETDLKNYKDYINNQCSSKTNLQMEKNFIENLENNLDEYKDHINDKYAPSRLIQKIAHNLDIYKIHKATVEEVVETTEPEISFVTDNEESTKTDSNATKDFLKMIEKITHDFNEIKKYIHAHPEESRGKTETTTTTTTITEEDIITEEGLNIEEIFEITEQPNVEEEIPTKNSAELLQQIQQKFDEFKKKEQYEEVNEYKPLSDHNELITFTNSEELNHLKEDETAITNNVEPMIDECTIKQHIRSSDIKNSIITVISDEPKLHEVTTSVTKENMVSTENISEIVMEESTSEFHQLTELYQELIVSDKAIKLSSTCNLNDYNSKNHCICSVQQTIKDLFDDIRDINSARNYKYECRRFIRIEPGITISNKSESKILRKRRIGEFSEIFFWKRDANVGRDITYLLDQELNLPTNGSVTYVSSGSKVVIPCNNEENGFLNYIWTVNNGSPETTGDLINNGSSLEIPLVNPEDSNNYTCTVTNDENEKKSYIHQLSVVSLPLYSLVVTVKLNASSHCSLDDMAVLNLYYPVALKDLLCSGASEQLCSVAVEKPQCIRLGSDHIISLHVTLSITSVINIFPNLNSHACSLSCQSRMYSIVVGILFKNLASVTNLPVFFRLRLKTADVIPIQYNRGDTSNMVSNSIATVCPPGMGIFDNPKICLACEPYTFNTGNEKTCQPCPKGSYQPGVGSRMCLPCKSPLDDPSCFLPSSVADMSRKYYLIPVILLFICLTIIIGCISLHKRLHLKKIKQNTKLSKNSKLARNSKVPRNSKRPNSIATVEKENVRTSRNKTKSISSTDQTKNPPELPPIDF